MLRETFPRTRLIVNTENRGFACASNQAMREAIGRYLLLLNSDTQMIDDSIHRMLAFMEDQPQAGAAGVRLLNADGSLQAYPIALPSLWTICLQMVGMGRWSHAGSSASFTSAAHPAEVERVKGACLMVRREVIADVGPLDETLFLYGEEDDWCLRIRKAGWKVFYLPDAQVLHVGRASVDQVDEDMYLQLYESKVAFYRKHRGLIKTLLLKSILFLGSWARLTVAAIRHVVSRRQRETSRGRIRRCWRLLLELPRL
jgi:GT2 family glycosyltransferase